MASGDAGVAQSVERNLAKVEVAGSKPVSRSTLPIATYRLQLHAGFDLHAAAGLTDYLHKLGVSHLYSSPVFQGAGSTHGYDVADASRVSAELGGEAGFAALSRSLKARGLGLVLDIVPNHMSTDARHNLWWRDVLRAGPESRYAAYFDVDWARRQGRVLLAVLGKTREAAAEAGELRLEPGPDGPLLRYFEHEFPLRDTELPTSATEPEDVVRVLAGQHYELGFWRDALGELNYRRFFDIADLIGVRVEDPDVFAASHARVLAWLNDGTLAGVRIDHVDGLADPAEYLQRLRSAIPGSSWIVVEKVLQPDETLPPWPVAGTTGYDFLNSVLGLFVDASAERGLTDFYSRFTAEPVDYRALVQAKKEEVMDMSFTADLALLADLLEAATGVPPAAGRRALRAVIACFPVYRAYVGDGPATAEDVARVSEAISCAVHGHLEVASVAPGIEGALLRERTSAAVRFRRRFQQLTPAVMAKGVEDTAFYCFNRLVALNEVGGDPSRFGRDPEQVHAELSRRATTWPGAMLSTATHDTKRGEDTRARLALLSEIPERWAAAVEAWSRINARHRQGDRPDRNAEYLFYQTVVGAHPLSPERAVSYMGKAAREAKQHTSWLEPDLDYETCLEDFVRGSLADPEFQTAVDDFCRRLEGAGWVNGLAQKLVALTAPGVPDLYQGTELWDVSLVDPDNRRPVDFERRRALLERAGSVTARAAWAEAASGLPKLFLVLRTLALRQREPAAFAGTYRPLRAQGPQAGHVFAYARAERVVVVVPRLSLRRGPDWEDATLELPPGEFQDVLSARERSGRVRVGDLFADFPVALLGPPA